MSTDYDSNMTMLDKVQKQKPSAHDDTATQSRLYDAIEAFDGPVGEEEPSNGKFNFWSCLKQAKLLGLVGTASALVLTVALVITTSVSTPAFASVVKKLAEITSMVYTGQMRSNEHIIMTVEVFYQSPNKIRVVNTPLPGIEGAPTVVNVMDTELGKGLILFPDRKVAMPINFTPGRNAKEALEDELFDWHTKILNYDGEVAIEPAVVINGIETTVFIIEPENMKLTLWVNPLTELPIRIRVETMTEQSFVFEADVTFNKVIDPVMFDLAPSDYKTMGTDPE
jgi:outer membrane lipoprotein-sorting protein